ncbi:potassium channel, subfamily K, member 7 [Brachyhypopomus gauderio]|uniref:potassium channel, subfamily K, member 7 n=1 Tax=Brachyhypopomus gauderio TaxID=698409 RepID=UPI0040421DA2
MAHSAESLLTFCRSYAFTVLTIVYVLYLITGGVIFMCLEQPEADLLDAEAHGFVERFLEDHKCVQERNLNHLLRKVFFANRRGVAVLKSESDEYNFDFTSSLFFIITFLTTTGCDIAVPLSDEARVFCMLYCLTGIPFTFFLLSSITDALLPRVTHAPIRYLQIYWGLSHNRAALLCFGGLATCTATLFLVLPAIALCLLERDWSFLQSLYFCFTSLSTIGLEDYLPGRTQSQSVRLVLELATSCYLALGLVVLLVVLESFWELHQVQALLRVCAGPHVRAINGIDLDEMAPSGDPADGLQYTCPISTISPHLSSAPTTTSVDHSK